MRYFIIHLVQQVNQMMALLLAFLLLLWSELREKRKRKGLSIEDAAEVCEVDPSTYARWERGKQIPHPRHFQVLMDKSTPMTRSGSLEMNYVPDEFLPPSYWND